MKSRTVRSIAAVLFDANHEPGTYQIPIHATGLPSGTYFFALRIGGEVETKKMHLVDQTMGF